MSDNLMPIGRFASACRLSVKALRHYAEVGVLVPAHVDSTTGYRYYSRAQARSAVMIGMLRSLGVGLPRIAEILAASDSELADLIDVETSRVEGELLDRQNALRSLRRIAKEGSLTPYGITLTTEPEWLLLEMNARTTAEHLVPDSTALIYRLLVSIAEAGVQVREPIMGINEDPDANGDIVVHAYAGRGDSQILPEDASLVELAGGLCATLQHIGPYEELGLAHHSLYAWAQTRGHESRGLVREIYRNSPEDSASEELVTDVLLPIK